MSALDLFSLAALTVGAGFFVAGTVGLLRFPDLHTRLHALTKADNLGLGFVVLGVMPHLGGLLPALKVVGVWVLAMLAAGTAAQLVARAALPRRPPPEEG
ncbi:cation:proton antiporter [Salinarimonas rosea]|uniref:cation:proton antiporter n=1 Tax=Salinarimonas rosea TaxID=552063 RepID=UPI0004130F9F|nr:monovalent cation/H(+) antiporter subunit G [Salinarimonas rosea]